MSSLDDKYAAEFGPQVGLQSRQGRSFTFRASGLSVAPQEQGIAGMPFSNPESTGRNACRGLLPACGFPVAHARGNASYTIYLKSAPGAARSDATDGATSSCRR